MEIKACPKCGSKKIYQGRMGDGVLTGYSNKDVCRNCGYQGMPIIFDSEQEYTNFLKSKTTSRLPIIKNNKKENIQKKSKRPLGVIILALLIIIEAIFTIFLYYGFRVDYSNTWLWVYYIIVFVISAIVLPLGLISGKSWAWTIGGILFALSIPIGLIFLYYLTRPHVKKFFGKL
jgi:hypothetical protein